jgi:tetratricopeptide (TPR) repeat protein
MTAPPPPGPRRLHRATAVAALLALAGAAACVSSLLPAPRGWIEVRSEHFVFYTDLDREHAESLAVDLELFRAAVLHFTNVAQLDAPIPVRIYVFARESTFDRFRRNRNVGGFTLATPRSYLVAFAGGTKENYRRTLYHEYVHFLVQNQPTLLYPRWYDEGFAEFLSTLELDGSQVIVGSAHPERAPWLVHAPRLPLEQVLDSSAYAHLDDDEMVRFYAWSWLLVHYLSIDHPYEPGDGITPHLERYIRELEAGRSEEESFEVSWGFGTKELQRRLDRLLRDGVQRGAIPIERLDFEREVAIAPLSEAQAATRLGELALYVGEGDLARAYFEIAVEHEPDDFRALAGLGDTWKIEQQWERAEVLFERAVSLAPEDPLTRLDRGEFWLSRANETTDPAERSAALERARADFAAVLAQNPEQVEALTVLGMSHLVPGGDVSLALPPLEKALTILPRDWMVQTQLLHAYAGLDRTEDAQRIARRLLVAAHSRDQVEELRAFLTEAELEPTLSAPD